MRDFACTALESILEVFHALARTEATIPLLDMVHCFLHSPVRILAIVFVVEPWSDGREELVQQLKDSRMDEWQERRRTDMLKDLLSVTRFLDVRELDLEICRHRWSVNRLGEACRREEKERLRAYFASITA